MSRQYDTHLSYGHNFIHMYQIVERNSNNNIPICYKEVPDVHVADSSTRPPLDCIIYFFHNISMTILYITSFFCLMVWLIL